MLSNGLGKQRSKYYKSDQTQQHYTTAWEYTETRRSIDGATDEKDDL